MYTIYYVGSEYQLPGYNIYNIALLQEARHARLMPHRNGTIFDGAVFVSNVR